MKSIRKLSEDDVVTQKTQYKIQYKYSFSTSLASALYDRASPDTRSAASTVSNFLTFVLLFRRDVFHALSLPPSASASQNIPDAVATLPVFLTLASKTKLDA